MLASPSADVGEGVRVLVNVEDVALRAENRLQDGGRVSILLSQQVLTAPLP